MPTLIYVHAKDIDLHFLREGGRPPSYAGKWVMGV